MIRLCLFVSLLLSGGRCSEELCKRSSEFVEKDSEIIPNVVVWLHTTPVKDSHFSSNLKPEFEQEWALLFYFPDTGREMTHKGVIKNGEGYSCSHNGAPKEIDGSQKVLLGIISGSPKRFVNFAEENDGSLKCQSDQALTFSQNWVMNMAKRLGGDIWNQMENPSLFFEELKEEGSWIQMKTHRELVKVQKEETLESQMKNIRQLFEELKEESLENQMKNIRQLFEELKEEGLGVQMKTPGEVHKEKVETLWPLAEENLREYFRDHNENTFDWDDVKCAASLGVDILLLYYGPVGMKGRELVAHAYYLAMAGYYGYHSYHKTTTYHLCSKTILKLEAKYGGKFFT